MDQRPEASEYAEFYAGYVASVPDGPILETLRSQLDELESAMDSATTSQEGAYAPGKWTLRELVGHMIDTERVMAYRALVFARGDQAALPGFEQDDYVVTAGSDARSLPDLLREFESVRQSTLRFFESLPDDAWSRTGTASERQWTVRALAWVIAGHLAHHLKIIRERYLA